jgi:GNAT superfamily N-acetyltransferase
VSDGPHHFDVRQLARDDSDFGAALHLVLDVPRRRITARSGRRVEEFREDVGRRSQSIDLLFGAYDSGGLAGAGLAVESPGKAALVLAGGNPADDRSYAAIRAALTSVRDAAWDRSIRLLEVLTPIDADRLGKSVADVGFRHLTQLIYLQREVSRGASPTKDRSDVTFVHYTEARDELFQETLDRTYAQSLDCPELTGLRSAAEILAGHRATGEHDPALWSVAMCEQTPVGVLLLSPIARSEALEVVYTGVTPPARGKGVGDALLARAIQTATRTSAKQLALAVDERNAPARRLYGRWGFVECARRDAWIATSPLAGTCEKQYKTKGFPAPDAV